MKPDGVEENALNLSEADRATLAVKLFNSLPHEEFDVTDEEVEKREEELRLGLVEEMSHEEFIRRVEQERGQ